MTTRLRLSCLVSRFLLPGILLASLLVSCAEPSPQVFPTAQATATPEAAAPTAVPTTAPPAPTGTLPVLTRAQADRIGIGVFAVTVYDLLYGPEAHRTAVDAIRSWPSDWAWPSEIAIAEGGTLTLAYDRNPPYDGAARLLDAMVVSYTWTDTSGTVRWTRTADSDPMADWRIRKDDVKLDLTAILHPLCDDVLLDAEDLIARIGTPNSDVTVVDDPGQGDIYRVRTVLVDGLELEFRQLSFTTDPDLWAFEICRITEPGYATLRGLAVGMSETDVSRHFGNWGLDIRTESVEEGVTEMTVSPIASAWSGPHLTLRIRLKDGRVDGISISEF